MPQKEKKAVVVDGPQTVPSRNEIHRLTTPKATQFPDDQSREYYDRLLKRAGMPLALCGPLVFNCDGPERLHLARVAQQWLNQLELGRHTWNEFGRSSYVPSNSSGLFFAGPPGAGKSLLAAIITRHILFQGVVGIRPRCNAIWKTTAQFLIDCRAASTGQGDESESEFWERYESASLVILDDVGTSNLNVWESGRLCHLIDTRQVNCQALFISTNLPRQELHRAIGQRSASRLWELPALGPFPSEDYREQRGQGFRK